MSLFVAAIAVSWPGAPARGQAPRVPSARLVSASTLTLPASVDSNSPAVWERVDGRLRFFVLASFAGQTRRTEGSDLQRLSASLPVTFENHPGAGVWFEAIVPDVDGTWYGFYHNEWAAEVCNEQVRTIPRIGAARSQDFGITWQNLGVILAAPAGTYDCGSANEYFVGGVGDFSVMLDDEARYLYMFFSQYADRESVQGVSVARMAWADRDAPIGKVSVWLRENTWLPTRTFRIRDQERQFYPAGAPIYPAATGWHDTTRVDAFWGPSVHWNTYLQQYVMLLNRARDGSFSQEGIYVAFSPTLENPASWSAPQRVLSGGRWYPQVIGTESGTGTDRIAGERARFFMSGRSDHTIQFVR